MVVIFLSRQGLNYILSSRRCRQSDQIFRKIYGTGETRTHDHAFRGHLLYHWATGPYWTSRLSSQMVELEVNTIFFKNIWTIVLFLIILIKNTSRLVFNDQIKNQARNTSITIKRHLLFWMSPEKLNVRSRFWKRRYELMKWFLFLVQRIKK